MEKPEMIKIEITQELVNEYNNIYFENHQRAKKAPIEHTYLTTLNDMLLIPNKAMRNARKQTYHDFISFVIDKYEIWGLKICSCSIHVLFTFSNNRRRDLDNSFCGFMKPFLDACTLNEVIIDDSTKVIKYLSTTSEVEKGIEKTTVTIYNIE